MHVNIHVMFEILYLLTPSKFNHLQHDIHAGTQKRGGGGGWGLSKYFGEASASPLFHFEFTAINRVNSEFSTRHYRYADVLFNALIHIIAKTLLVKICSHRRPLDEIHFLSCNVHNIHTCIYKYISNSFILVESLSSDLT